MARYTGPKHRLARKEGVNILEKHSPSLERRLNVPPGQLGSKRPRRKPSDYSRQLREKQKAKRTYGYWKNNSAGIITCLLKKKVKPAKL